LQDRRVIDLRERRIVGYRRAFLDVSEVDVAQRRRNGSAALDETDTRLLRLLEDNARLSLADLARTVALSPQSVGERLKRLEDTGVLAGYTVRLDARALGLGIAAYIRVRPMIGELPRVAKLIQDCPEVVECDRITGDDCFIAKVYVERVEDLERVIDRLIPFAQTNTSIVQSSPVARRSPAYGV
jgi:Lrp/AsnC family transcriptional regulator, leucine-responsive regulatory protein